MHAFIICSWCAAVECNISIWCYIVHFEQQTQFAVPCMHQHHVSISMCYHLIICSQKLITLIVPHVHRNHLSVIDALIDAHRHTQMPFTLIVPHAHGNHLSVIDALIDAHRHTQMPFTLMVPHVHQNHLSVIYTLLYLYISLGSACT